MTFFRSEMTSKNSQKSPCSLGGDSFAGGNLEDQDLCDCIIEGSDPRFESGLAGRRSVHGHSPSVLEIRIGISKKDGNLEIAWKII